MLEFRYLTLLHLYEPKITKLSLSYDFLSRKLILLLFYIDWQELAIMGENISEQTKDHKTFT